MKLRKKTLNDLLRGDFISFAHDLKELCCGIPLIVLDKVAPLIPDKVFIKLKWRLCMDYPLDLENPKTFNEKLQWLKLHDRKPLYTLMVDKAEAKNYVKSIIGEEFIIPTVALYNGIEDVDFKVLPDQFVMKCTHDSGGVVICRDKSKLDKNAALKTLSHFLHRRYYYQNREWPYKNVKPRIIVEKYMEDDQTKELRDYKFFCFDGEVKALFIASDRQNKDEETKFDFFDSDYNHLNIKNGHPNADVIPAKPQSFDLMKKLAAKLSKGIPHVRVDFYEVNGKVFFGELTFTHWSGFVPFEPREWDLIFGGWITIPENKEEC